MKVLLFSCLTPKDYFVNWRENSLNREEGLDVVSVELEADLEKLILIQ